MTRTDALKMIASKSLPAALTASVAFALLDVEFLFNTPGALERFEGYTAAQAADMATYYRGVVEPACKAILTRKAGSDSTGRGGVENERG